jgi:hypothetical protein
LWAASTSSFASTSKIQPVGGEFARDVLQRLDLGSGQAEPAEPVGARLADGVMIERVEGRRKPPPDRRGACGRHLLAADDVREPRKARLALAQRRHAGLRQDRLQPRVLLHQRLHGVFKVGLVFEADRAWRRAYGFFRCASWPGFGTSCAVTAITDTCPPPVFRFAPSPNGFLHLGHAYSALLNFDLARQRGGKFLLRIEDIDATRCRPEYEAAIYEDLAWLGIVWETPVRRQSEHFAAYREAIDKLSGAGPDLSELSRAARDRATGASARAGRAWPRDPDGAPLYPGRRNRLPPAERGD